MASLFVHTLFGDLSIQGRRGDIKFTVKIASAPRRVLMAAVVEHARLNPNYLGYQVPGPHPCHNKAGFQEAVDKFRSKLTRDRRIIGVYSPLFDTVAGEAA